MPSDVDRCRRQVGLCLSKQENTPRLDISIVERPEGDCVTHRRYHLTGLAYVHIFVWGHSANRSLLRPESVAERKSMNGISRPRAIFDSCTIWQGQDHITCPSDTIESSQLNSLIVLESFLEFQSSWVGIGDFFKSSRGICRIDAN
jgi:hypothetical protein